MTFFITSGPVCFYNGVVRPKDTNGIADSVDCVQTAFPTSKFLKWVAAWKGNRNVSAHDIPMRFS